MDDAPLAGLTIGITAERRAEEQASMLRARGARTLWGPTLRVFTIADDEELRAATEDVVRRPPDFVLASTGFGMRTWLSAAEAWGRRAELVEALARAKVLNRGAKAASANTAAGIPEWWRAPDERFDELLDRIEHVQVADNPGRHQPGTGEINYPFVFDHIDGSGYDGWVGLEYVPDGDTRSSLEWVDSYGLKL